MWPFVPFGRATLLRKIIITAKRGNRDSSRSFTSGIVCTNCRLLQTGQAIWTKVHPNSIRQFTTTLRNCQMRKNPAKPKEKISVKNTSWTDVKRLMSLAKPEKRRLAVAIGLLTISSGVTLSVPFFLGRLIDMVFQPTETSAEVEAVGGDKKESTKDRLQRYCGILAVVFVVGAVANFGRIYLMNSSGERVVNRLRTTVFGNLLRQEIGFFDKNKTGELINRLSNDTSVIGYATTMNISDGLRSVAAAVGGVGMMFYVSPKLAVVGLSIVPPIAFLAVGYGRYVHKLTQKVNDALADATQVAEERISNIRTIRAFATEHKEDLNYKEKIEKVLQLAYSNAMASGIFYGFTGLSGNLSVLAVLYTGGSLIAAQEITIGDLSSFLMYVMYVGVSIGGISSFYSELMRGLGSSTRLFELANRKPLVPIEGGRQLDNFKGNIEFRNVFFSYPGRADAPILTDFNLTCPAGTVTALVGPSGSGKSTIGSLLLRFYDVDKGGVYVDGVDLREVDPTWLRQQFGVVSQEPILFSSSVRDNICYGWPDPNAVSLETIYDGVRKANAYNFIKAFPDELNTVLGEKGANLSGGQRQRVAIARALLQDPTVLLLDEATSALDSESEFLVREALNNLILRDRDRTVIMIAHRLSTVKHADQIAVMTDGKIAEKGSYDQLMSIPNGHFRRLIERQTIAVDDQQEEKKLKDIHIEEESDSEVAVAKSWTQPAGKSI